MQEKKLGGVLVELDPDRQLIFISLGLNVLSRPQDWPDETRSLAISLAMIKDQPWDRNLLLAQIGSTWESLWQGAASDQGETVMGYCRRYSTTIGQRVSFHRNGAALTGLAHEIDENGRLVIETGDGRRHAFLLEEVCNLRVVSSTINPDGSA